jgi:hypothetical protein
VSFRPSKVRALPGSSSKHRKHPSHQRLCGPPGPRTPHQKLKRCPAIVHRAPFNHSDACRAPRHQPLTHRRGPGTIGRCRGQTRIEAPRFRAVGGVCRGSRWICQHAPRSVNEHPPWGGFGRKGRASRKAGRRVRTACGAGAIDADHVPPNYMWPHHPDVGTPQTPYPARTTVTGF